MASKWRQVLAASSGKKIQFATELSKERTTFQSACIGSFGLGTALAWTSPAIPRIDAGQCGNVKRTLYFLHLVRKNRSFVRTATYPAFPLSLRAGSVPSCRRGQSSQGQSQVGDFSESNISHRKLCENSGYLLGRFALAAVAP